MQQAAITLDTEVLVVGGGTGGTAAAIQAARRGAQTILVSEFDWLGGMLTSAGVAAPDGNELEAWQTGIWGDFLAALAQRQPGGLDHGWVSFFTYEPRIGAAIFADWVKALPNLRWIAGQTPIAVMRSGDRVTGVEFPDYRIQAQITLDGTELGDLLALGNIPHRWGWELRSAFDEPSAPPVLNDLTAQYPVQAPTWVVILQDFGAGIEAPAIPAPPHYDPQKYFGAWDNYGGERCLNYGRLPGDRFMLNWPMHGNDYGEGLDRLLGQATDRQAFLTEARWHTQGFAHFIQTQLGRRYGLATDAFPPHSAAPHSAWAMHPYYRESRRLVGLTTVREQDILPLPGGQVAALPIVTQAAGCETVESWVEAIAIGNYALDHHYPSGDIPLSKKSLRWGGRWTGTPFTIPYRSLVSATITGFLACEKNIAVTHMANGATRLQPLVLGIGQAAGMAAALCVEHHCAPQQLNVRHLQDALITDPIAPLAVIPLLNLPPTHPQWQQWQRYYLDHPESYPHQGNAPIDDAPATPSPGATAFSGTFRRQAAQEYYLEIENHVWQIVTIRAIVQDQLTKYQNEQSIRLYGKANRAGNWILADMIEVKN
jgi:FAD dependent oxidoreductase